MWYNGCGKDTNTLVQTRIQFFFELISPPVDSSFTQKHMLTSKRHSSRADKGRNCALYDTGMKFGKQLEDTIRKFLAIGPSQIFPAAKMAAVFKMAAMRHCCLLEHQVKTTYNLASGG